VNGNDILNRINSETDKKFTFPGYRAKMKEEFKMKKIMTAIILSAFVIVLCGTTAFAVGRGRQETRSTAGSRQYSADHTCQGTGAFFTDTDGDGICDHLNTSGISGVCPYLESPELEDPATEVPAAEYRHHLRCAGIGTSYGACNGTGYGAGNGTGYGHHANR
jgi:hypothetical protein